MKLLSPNRLRRVAAWIALDLGFAASLLVISAWADTSASLQRKQTDGCYCGCAQSKTKVGCSKMCELPKYASRWWAVSCAKPRARTSAPATSPEARPRATHPDRPERASNDSPR